MDRKTSFEAAGRQTFLDPSEVSISKADGFL